MDFVLHFQTSDTILVVDNLYKIVGEYQRYLVPQTPAYELVNRTLLPSGRRTNYANVDFQDGIAILPPHLDEIVTDDNDKKFVAVADKHPENPPIVHATDNVRGWVKWEERLRDYDIEVIHLCPSEL